jgi:aminopeptidase N
MNISIFTLLGDYQMRCSVLLGCSMAALINIGTCPAVFGKPVSTAATGEVSTLLPRNAQPDHYAIRLVPDAKAMTFKGEARIDIDILQPSKIITLNAADMMITSAKISKSAKSNGMVGRITLATDQELASITFATLLPKGRYTLSVNYQGKINDQAFGLFAMDYKDVAGAEKRALFTSFQPFHARRFFSGMG